MVNDIGCTISWKWIQGTPKSEASGIRRSRWNQSEGRSVTTSFSTRCLVSFIRSTERWLKVIQQQVKCSNLVVSSTRRFAKSGGGLQKEVSLDEPSIMTSFSRCTPFSRIDLRSNKANPEYSSSSWLFHFSLNVTEKDRTIKHTNLSQNYKKEFTWNHADCAQDWESVWSLIQRMRIPMN